MTLLIRSGERRCFQFRDDVECAIGTAPLKSQSSHANCQPSNREPCESTKGWPCHNWCTLRLCLLAEPSQPRKQRPLFFS